jgi:PQQ-like domain
MRPLRRELLIIVFAALGSGGALLIIANRIPSRAIPAGILWESRYNGTANEADTPSAIAVDIHGDILVLGSSFGAKDGLVVLKYEGASGKLIWRQDYERASASSIVLDSCGDLYVAGSESKGFRNGPIAPPFSGPNTDILVLKYSGKNGELLWKQTYDSRHHDEDWAQHLSLDSSGNPVVSGFAANDTRYFGYIAKYSAADGHKIWERSGEDPPAVVLWQGSSGMKLDSRDDVVFAGSTKNDPFGQSDGSCLIHKLSGTSGRSLWQQKFDPEPASLSFIQALDLDREGNAFVVGYASDGRRDSVLTAKFGSSDGRLLWSRSYTSSLDGGDRPSAIIVESNGDVIVSVQSWNGSYTSSSYEGHTLKYSGTNGTLLWDLRRLVPANSATVAETCAKRGLVVEGRGTIILYGNQWNGKNIDYHLTWLSGRDGGVLREMSYDGPAGDHDLISGLILAPDGGQILTGSSSNCPEWLKPAKSLSYWLRTGRSWRGIARESNHVNDDDPYNYDFVTVKFPPVPDLEKRR